MILGQSRTQTPQTNNLSPVSLFNQTTANLSPSNTSTLPLHKVSYIVKIMFMYNMKIDFLILMFLEKWGHKKSSKWY